VEIAITGASGLIGTALRPHLEAAGHRVVPIGRSVVDGIRWDPAAGELDAASLEGIDAVVHLAGEGIATKRWTEAQKARILDSRVQGTTLLATTLADLARPPRTLLSASGANVYRDGGDRELDEGAPHGDTFLSGVVEAWEGATAPAAEAGVRVAFLRNGGVFSADGGLLGPLGRLYRFGLGGRIGSGRQYMSWISIVDEVAIIEWLLDHEVAGPVNMCAPGAATNAEFNAALAHAVHRPAILPIPAFGPKIVFGSELVDELLLTSLRTVPRVLLDHGYEFRHPEIGPALADLLGRD
jgi:uncharacterized protein (TIGR01777 family)